MVVRFNTGKNMRGALLYNEKKVQSRQAVCLLASGFGREAADLTLVQKAARFEKLAHRNLNVRTHVVHVSLNFDPSEKLADDQLISIADAYMSGIGFSGQPYLVYRHDDTAHQHLHITSVSIRPDGSRINLHNIGRNQSEHARQSIEREFGLVKAAGRTAHIEHIIQPVVYGTAQTRKSIASVVNRVSTTYRYTSLPEYNAILQQYNVYCSNGTEGSRIRATKGLVYGVLDPKGNRVGVPVKASALYGKPTLPWLEKKFRLNEALRMPYRQRVRSCIDQALAGDKPVSTATFRQRLARQGIHVVFRTNAEGLRFGMTFVDNRARVVFNGSDLGKTYGAKAINERLTDSLSELKVERVNALVPDDNIQTGITLDLLNELIVAKADTEPSVPRKRKRRKRKRPSR